MRPQSPERGLNCSTVGKAFGRRRDNPHSTRIDRTKSVRCTLLVPRHYSAKKWHPQWRLRPFALFSMNLRPRLNDSFQPYLQLHSSLMNMGTCDVNHLARTPCAIPTELGVDKDLVWGCPLQLQVASQLCQLSTSRRRAFHQKNLTSSLCVFVFCAPYAPIQGAHSHGRNISFYVWS